MTARRVRRKETLFLLKKARERKEKEIKVLDDIASAWAASLLPLDSYINRAPRVTDDARAS